MRKFLNEPEDVGQGVAGRPRGRARRPPARTMSRAQIVVRSDAPVRQGRTGLRRRLWPRAAARRVRRAGHARRRLSRVRSSPRRPDQMLAATKAVDGGAGVIHIVKNYTGDVMNFKLAAETRRGRGHRGRDGPGRRRRRRRGQPLHGRPPRRRRDRAAGEDRRRARPRRRHLADVAAIARRVNERVRSFGVALSSCTPPAAGTPDLRDRPGEIEFGVGIHGEPGRRREQIAHRARDRRR